MNRRTLAREEALTIVRHGLRDVREWLGEETPEQATHEARHAPRHASKEKP